MDGAEPWLSLLRSRAARNGIASSPLSTSVLEIHDHPTSSCASRWKDQRPGSSSSDDRRVLDDIKLGCGRSYKPPLKPDVCAPRFDAMHNVISILHALPTSSWFEVDVGLSSRSCAAHHRLGTYHSTTASSLAYGIAGVASATAEHAIRPLR
jgi:hypothetical protein